MHLFLLRLSVRFQVGSDYILPRIANGTVETVRVKFSDHFIDFFLSIFGKNQVRCLIRMGKCECAICAGVHLGNLFQFITHSLMKSTLFKSAVPETALKLIPHIGVVTPLTKQTSKSADFESPLL